MSSDQEWMTLGEANWVLWGLALESGLCPRCRFPLTYVDHEGQWLTVQHCARCYRDWYLNTRTVRCLGWSLAPDGWYYSPEGRPIFRKVGK